MCLKAVIKIWLPFLLNSLLMDLTRRERLFFLSTRNSLQKHKTCYITLLVNMNAIGIIKP